MRLRLKGDEEPRVLEVTEFLSEHEGCIIREFDEAELETRRAERNQNTAT